MTEPATLKSLTWDLHKLAEQTPLMNSLLNNQISQNMYSDLVYTKYAIYASIESKIQFKTSGLARAQLALNDWQQMGQHMPPLLSELTAMVDHLNNLSEPELWAHVYVQYLAPLYGGQIIKRTIQHRFPTSMYDFTDPHACQKEIRERLHVNMAEEANRSFQMTINYYNQLWDSHAQSN